MSSKLILFVCTGNVCRSPIAEYLLKKHLNGAGRWVVGSAGTCALENQPPTPAAVAVMAEHGIDISGHRSRPLTRQLVEQARVIVAMTAAHARAVSLLYPPAVEKTFVIGSFDDSRDEDIEDPIGLSDEAYRRVRDKIARAMPGLASFLNALE